MTRTAHLWAEPAAQNDPVHVLSADLIISSHRRRLGAYTAGAQLLRHAVPELLARHPDRVGLRATEVVALAPDLASLLPQPPQTLTNTAPAAERTRFYPWDRTQRLAHGAVEMLIEWAQTCHPDGYVVAFVDFDEADRTDRELVATLVRRCDPGVLTVVVVQSGSAPTDVLGRTLAAHTRRTDPVTLPTQVAQTGTDLAQRYIDADGIGVSEQERQAYASLPPAERAARHTARADALALVEDPLLARGALCYHREHGVDAVTVGAAAVRDAVLPTFGLGYYHAALELALRGAELVAPTKDVDELGHRRWYDFTHTIGACFAYLDRGAEALEYIRLQRRSTTDPEHQMGCCYLTAMLYTRLLPKAQLDHDRALELINTAISLADQLSATKQHEVDRAFMRNARALVELHRGDLVGALVLVDEAIGITDRTLEPDEYRLHRSVLRYNRAQILATQGDFTGALAEFDEIIRRDPEYGDYYFDRAAVHRSAGHHELALTDYEVAIALTPPFFEAHYNRADLLRDLGYVDEARADLDYAIELEPAHVETRLARADLAVELGELEQAQVDIAAGLAIEPNNPHLLSVKGAALADAGHIDGALEAYGAALTADPRLAASLANRAILFYSLDRFAEAVDDLDRALAITDVPDLRLNRAIALAALDRHVDAVRDLDAALAGEEADVAEILFRRGLSRHALGLTGAADDLAAHLELAGSDSPYTAEIVALGVELASTAGRAA